MATGYYYNTKELLSFNPVTSQLTVSVTTKWAPTDATVSSYTLVVTLPFDENGNVPTDPSQIDAIIEDRINVRIGDVTKKIPPGGVTNATDIYALTTTDETISTINVLLVPQPLEGESYMNFTRSVMCVYDTIMATPSGLPLDRNTLPSPYSLGHGVHILDNGNINLALLTNIQGNSNFGPYQSATITWDPANTVPPGVLAQFPWILNPLVDTNAPGFNLDDYNTFFYIEHDPMSIIGNFAAGYFTYS